MTRQEWTPWFLSLADKIAERATCPRLHCGAVAATQDHHIIATGYNGSLPQQPHCEDVGCDVGEGHCQRTIHAEVNLIAQAAKYGNSLAGATVYLTHSPCWPCCKSLLSAGVVDVVYRNVYRFDERILTVMRRDFLHGDDDSAWYTMLPRWAA